MVQSNFGIRFIPEPLAIDAIAQNQVYKIPVLEDISPRTISIIYDTEYPQSLAAKEFLKFLTLLF
jgi:DNA-binding transcriptional LysR family regulator